jgi:hypothetical protein
MWQESGCHLAFGLEFDAKSQLALKMPLLKDSALGVCFCCVFALLLQEKTGTTTLLGGSPFVKMSVSRGRSKKTKETFGVSAFVSL